MTRRCARCDGITEQNGLLRRVLAEYIAGNRIVEDYWYGSAVGEPTGVRDHMSIFDWKVDTPVDDIIGEAVGAASMCWEHVDKAGVFDSQRASAIVDEVMQALRQKLWVSEISS